jgi:CheY-like chemotaxis protein/HPt (histidine-containing phosphotransfer) domain-containing protein
LQADSSGGEAAMRGAPPSRSDALLRHRLILVAEDNETNRVVILQQLAVIGLAAEVAVDGREALARWRTGDYALLLTDLHMPLLDGYALTRAIRSEETPGKRIPIIALTANALRDEELRCLAVGMDAYLSKPVRLAQLRASIEEWLAPAQAAAALPAPIAATPPADLEVLVALVGDDPAVIDEVLQSFRHSAAESSAALDQAIATDSSQGAAGAAHRLKSAARSIGALRVGDLCDEIERAAKAQSAGELKALLPLFHAELDAVLKFLDSR